MKHYIIQRKRSNHDHWHVIAGMRYETLREARAAFNALPLKTGYRIAESYSVVRYKAVKL